MPSLQHLVPRTEHPEDHQPHGPEPKGLGEVKVEGDLDLWEPQPVEPKVGEVEEQGDPPEGVDGP